MNGLTKKVPGKFVQYILSIDVGTTSLKTLLLEKNGTIIASCNNEYPLIQRKAGWAEQDPACWWEAALNGIASVIKNGGISPDKISCIGLSGQFQSLVMLDKNGKVIRDAILWCDQRSKEILPLINQKVGEEDLIKHTANSAMVGSTVSLLLWVRANEPEIYSCCAHIMLPHEYLRYRLTGEYAADVTAASSMQLLNIPERRWSKEVMNKLEIDPSLTGTLVECCDLVGKVTQTASLETGLAPGIPVVGGGGDSVVSGLGTGIVRAGSCFTSIGTSGIIMASTDTIPIDRLGCGVSTYCAAVPGKWVSITCSNAAGISLRWLRDICFTSEIKETEKKGKSPYQLMDELAKDIPPGADGLLFLPYLWGDRTPHQDPDARGVFFGLSTLHTRSHMVRAVLEGVAYSLLDGISVLEELGITLSDFLLCGGGVRSILWRQIIADIYGKPVTTVQNDDGAAVGAAVLAAAGAGMYSDVAQACDAMIHRNPSEPYRPENHGKYIHYAGLYRKLYIQLKNMFQELKEITKNYS